jgi:hypothetical protein
MQCRNILNRKRHHMQRGVCGLRGERGIDSYGTEHLRCRHIFTWERHVMYRSLGRVYGECRLSCNWSNSVRGWVFFPGQRDLMYCLHSWNVLRKQRSVLLYSRCCGLHVQRRVFGDGPDSM